MIKTDQDYKSKSAKYDCQWLLNKVKTIVSGLDTKTNKMVSLHGDIISFMTMRQYQQESNVETLNLSGGSHILASDKLINKPVTNTSDADRRNKKDYFLAVAFILRSNESRY